MAQRSPRQWIAVGLAGGLLGFSLAGAAEASWLLPCAFRVTLDAALLAAAEEGRLTVVVGDAAVPAQFVADARGANRGLCLWLATAPPDSAPVLKPAPAGSALPMLRVTPDEAGQLLVLEGDEPVLRYNFRNVPVPAGVTGPYAVARSDYIHPLFGPEGEPLTTDYSQDHPHHRGIYWAWPEVTCKGTMHDLHALQGVFARPDRLVRTQAGPVAAVIEAENLWLWEDQEPIVRETVRIHAFRAASGLRCLDLALRFAALQPGVTIARRNQTAYGGLSLRFSAREGQQIVKHSGPARFPAPACWGELRGTAPGGSGTVGVAILPHPGNPHYPEDWVDYPELNWLQPATPMSGTACALLPEAPLELRYRLVLRHGDGAQADLHALWQHYLADWAPFAGLADYRFGQDTALLRAWEQRLSGCPQEEWPAIEAALLPLLEVPRNDAELRRWACDQLKRFGSAAAVPALIALLHEPELAASAADALETLPGPAVNQGIRQALTELPPERQAQAVALLGARRDAEAVTVLTRLARGQAPELSTAAAAALGSIGTLAAAETLAQCLDALPATVPLMDAALVCAGRLGTGSPEAQTTTNALLRLVLAKAPAAQQRHSALAQLAESAAPEALATALQWLAAGTPLDRRGAAMVLHGQPASAVSAALARLLPALADDAALVAIEVLAARPDRGLASAVLARLADSACGAAAARFLGLVGDPSCVPALAGLALNRSEAGDAARQALLSLPGAGVDAAIRTLAQNDDAGLRRLAADLLSARLGSESLADMMKLAMDPDPAVARRAFGTLGDLGDASVAPALVDQLPALPPTQRGEALAALSRIARRSGDVSAISERILRVTRYDGALYAEALGSLHGFVSDLAAAALMEALGGADAALAEAAGRALLKWPAAPPAELTEALRQALARAPTEPLKPVLEKALAHLTLLAARNLCQGRPATSSHPWQGQWGPEMAVDGIIATTSYWSCAESPSSLTVDFGEPLPVEAVRVVNFWDGTRFYQYRVELSPDGAAWDLVADMSANTAPATEAGTMHRFDRRTARHVRVTMLHNSANPGMHISELQAFSQLPPQE